MVNLGIFTIDDYLAIPVQANDTSGSAANLDSGSFSIDFYENDLGNSGGYAAMTTPDTTFNTQLDSKTGLYDVEVQLTAANGFEAGKQYICRVGEGTVDGETPATLYTWQVNADGDDLNLIASKIVAGFDADNRVDISKIEGNATIDGRTLTALLKRLIVIADDNTTGDLTAGTIIYKDVAAVTQITHTIDANGSRTQS